MKNSCFLDFFSIQTDKSIHGRLCFFSSIFRAEQLLLYNDSLILSDNNQFD